ncbi:MAG: beta-ketoacyl-ACP synthase II [Deltaproteobacteria bacterium]|nr:beta-ketoacyl-ACP synthase II [Deltaproteobacteria bacterium]
MRRVVVTGIGLLSPVGNSIDESWTNLMEGRSGIGPITLFDTERFESKFAGEVRGFDPTHFMEAKRVKEMGRFAQLAIGAGVLAWNDSGLGTLSDAERDRVGCIIGVGLGGIDFIETNTKNLLEKGPHRVSPYFIPGTIANMAAGQLAIRLGLRGPNFCTTSACSSGAHAIGESMHTILRGDADVVVAGGAEAAVTMLGISGFNALKALSRRNDDPKAASRPWDKKRDGFVMGEGSAVLVLEEFERARARGARIYAELVGYGASDDAFHITNPPQASEGAQRAMHAALKNARLSADQIGYVNAHATSTPAGDVQEALGIRRVFGAHADKLMVSSTKSMTGHLLGAAGSLEAAIVSLALHRGEVPPTINLDEPDEGCDLDFVPHIGRSVALDYTMTNAFGFGGVNTSLIFKKI